jgi:cytochrome c biogenesis protein CcdA
MITNKLAKTLFKKIVLFAAGFLPVFLYFCASAIGAMKGYCDFHKQK